MKKVLSVLLCILMCISVAPVAHAENSRDLSSETALASQLKTLGLFQGGGDTGDGTTDFALNRAPSKTEALVMLIRAIGKGTEAEAYPKTHHFSDVPTWADGYVSYAYDKGLTKGVSDTKFGAKNAASAEVYLTFMLRALGYSEGKEKDFSWDAPWALASYCGILPTQVSWTNFLRADVVTVTSAALYADIKGTQTTLGEQLESQGVFTKEQFNKAFPTDPFEKERLIDDQLSATIAARGSVGAFNENHYTTECHFITDTAEANNVLTVSFLVCYGTATLGSDNVVNCGGTIDLWQVELDAKTLQCTTCRTAGELLAKGLPLTDYFSKKSLEVRNWLSTNDLTREAMGAVCKTETQMQVDSGLIQYQKPTYQTELKKAKDSFSEITRTIETDACTILLGKPTDQTYYKYLLYLVFKPGSVSGDGAREVKASSAEGNLWLSDDKLTLYYSYHYVDGAVYEAFPPLHGDLPKSGTCSYTISLGDGGTEVQITGDS